MIPRALKKWPAVVLLGAGLLVGTVLHGAETRALVPVEGPALQARWTGVDAQGRWTFRVADEGRSLPPADLVSWGDCPDVGRRTLVVLGDGGLLAADVQGMDQDTLTVQSDLIALPGKPGAAPGPLTLPLDLLAGMVLVPPDLADARDRLLDRLQAAEGKADRLILLNGDELSGTLERIVGRSVHFRSGASAVPLELDRLRAALFNPALAHRPPRPSFPVWIGLSDGSRLLASRLASKDGRVELDAAGKTIQAPLEDVVWLMPLGPRVRYLSDLEPESHRQTPFVGQPWPYRRDRSVGGRWLRADGKVHFKGLGVHSRSQLVYAIAEPWRRFEVRVALDDESQGKGSVQFRVLVDGARKYESPIVAGNAPPLDVSVDLAGAKRLELLVDYGPWADQMDRADWLDARLVR